jgi:hypothetical protein
MPTPATPATTPPSQDSFDAFSLASERTDVLWTGIAFVLVVPAWVLVDRVVAPGEVGWRAGGRVAGALVGVALVAIARRARTVGALRLAHALGYVATAGLVAPLVAPSRHFALAVVAYSLWYWGLALGVRPLRWCAGIVAGISIALSAALLLARTQRSAAELVLAAGYLSSVAAIALLAVHARRNDAREMFEVSRALRVRTAELEEALASVKTLTGLLPFCSWCNRIRDDAGYWQTIEKYLMDSTGAAVTHGMCPECLAERYPEKEGAA